jgi:hypothetical protein
MAKPETVSKTCTPPLTTHGLPWRGRAPHTMQSSKGTAPHGVQPTTWNSFGEGRLAAALSDIAACRSCPSSVESRRVQWVELRHCSKDDLRRERGERARNGDEGRGGGGGGAARTHGVHSRDAQCTPMPEL